MSELKPLQWFLDRVGEIIVRDTQDGDAKAYIDLGTTAVFIKDKLQAKYMFDVQNDLYHDNKVNLNYRDYIK